MVESLHAPSQSEVVVPKLHGMLIVVPVHNEEELLARCLATIETAVNYFHEQYHNTRVAVVVVLDNCTDESREITLRFAENRPYMNLLFIDDGNTGTSRAAGVDHGLHLLCTNEPDWTNENIWIASTDADSMVPKDWLTGFAGLALAGVDVVLGTVEPDPEELAPVLYERWTASYTLEDGHDHIHGANLGVRASAYKEVGGFKDLKLNEDVDLVNRLRSAEYSVHATKAIHVITSARLESRVEGGFAEFLASLKDTTTEPLA